MEDDDDFAAATGIVNAVVGTALAATIILVILSVVLP
jgi:hypothetical protein